MTSKRVYIAAPYTHGDPVVNTQDVLSMAETLLEKGYTPLIPHLCHLWHLCSPHPYAYWIEVSERWLAMADCVLRLPGESKGASHEEVLAAKWGIPVYHSLSALQLGEK